MRFGKWILDINMADGSHFVKNFQKKNKLPEMRSKVNF